MADMRPSTAMEASLQLWHVHEWLWHERYPGVDTRNNTDNFKDFQKNLISECNELSWVRDIADAAKHRGLGRKGITVERVGKDAVFLLSNGRYVTVNGLKLKTQVLQIELKDGTKKRVVDVLRTVANFWDQRLAA